MKQRRTCDPSQCDHCEYVGEGGFFCDKYMEMVIDDWEPTENFEKCVQHVVKEVKGHVTGRGN